SGYRHPRLSGPVPPDAAVCPALPCWPLPACLTVRWPPESAVSGTWLPPPAPPWPGQGVADCPPRLPVPPGADQGDWQRLPSPQLCPIPAVPWSGPEMSPADSADHL